MAAITTRQTAGGGATVNNAPLTNAQLDTNFINLNNDIATKVSLTGATMTGSLLTDIGGGTTSSTKHIDLINGTGYDLFMLPRGGAGSYNPLVAAGDAIISFSAGAVNTGAITIGAWSTTSFGLRLDRLGATTLNALYGTTQLQDNVGFVLNGNYTDGRYSHRLRKFDDGGGVPLYIQSTMATAGTWTNLVKFGPNTADQNAFTVFGSSRTEGTLTVTGSLLATTKSFLIDHPTILGKKLRYGSLEGPENGVYVRGKLVGNNRIELPEYWTKLVDPDSITINLTPIGSHQNLYVEEIRDNVVVIKNGNLLLKEINCYYTVFAERVDVEKLEVECD